MCWCLFHTLLCDSCSKNPSVLSSSVTLWLRALLALPWALGTFCSWSSLLAFLSLSPPWGAILVQGASWPRWALVGVSLLANIRKRLYTSIQAWNAVLSHKTGQCHCGFKLLLPQCFAHHFPLKYQSFYVASLKVWAGDLNCVCSHCTHGCLSVHEPAVFPDKTLRPLVNS